MENPQRAFVVTILILGTYVASYVIALKPYRVSTRSPWAWGPPEPSYSVFGFGNSFGNQGFLGHFYAPLNVIDQEFIRPAYWEIDRKQTGAMQIVR
ncbi:MAG TPA: hypothetical protein VGM54_19275 [Chthoniobacter sp.]|jgi:hypothetical protein